MTLQEIENQAMKLPPAEREKLAEHLLSSLGSPALSDVDQAWIAEAERRLDDLDSGKAEEIPADEVFDGIRRELGWQR